MDDHAASQRVAVFSGWDIGAIAPQGVLLIIESVFPARIDASPASRGHAQGDVNMMVSTGGRQRAKTQFRDLLAAAGFAPTRIVATGIAYTSIVEARAG